MFHKITAMIFSLCLFLECFIKSIEVPNPLWWCVWCVFVFVCVCVGREGDNNLQIAKIKHIAQFRFCDNTLLTLNGSEQSECTKRSNLGGIFLSSHSPLNLVLIAT